MLESLLIAALYIIGVGYDVMKQIGKLRIKYPSLGFGEVWKTFFKEEWNTLMVSALGLCTVQILWFLAHYKNIPLPTWLHDWGVYLIVLFSGYALNRYIYSLLGTTEKVLDKRIEDIANKN